MTEPKEPDWNLIAAMICLHTDISHLGESVYPIELAKYMKEIHRQSLIPLEAANGD